jgi:hypothetical protein
VSETTHALHIVIQLFNAVTLGYCRQIKTQKEGVYIELIESSTDSKLWGYMEVSSWFHASAALSLSHLIAA